MRSRAGEQQRVVVRHPRHWPVVGRQMADVDRVRSPLVKGRFRQEITDRCHVASAQRHRAGHCLAKSIVTELPAQ